MEFRQQTLDNGLEIIAEINPAAYSASVGFFVRTGSRNETPDIAGTSHFLEHLVFKGTERCDAAEVNRRLDEMGADANAFTTEEQTVFFASMLPELLEDTVELFGEILRPSIAEADFDMEKLVILEEIKMYEDQPPFGVDDKSREIFYRGHPLAGSVLGTYASVSRLTVHEIKAYLNRRYRPDNIVLVAAGRLDFDRLVRKAEAVCGRWEPSKKPLNDEGDWRHCQGKRGFFQLSKESATQQYTMLLSDGPCCRDDERYAAGLLANILGDDSGSRLYWEMVDNGLADSAGLGTCEYFDNGVFVTGLISEPEQASEVLERTRKVYLDAKTTGLTQAELDRAKNKVLSRLVLANERPGGRLFAVGGDWQVRREYRTVRQDIETIGNITLREIHEILEKFPLDDPLIVTVGPLEILENCFEKEFA